MSEVDRWISIRLFGKWRHVDCLSYPFIMRIDRSEPNKIGPVRLTQHNSGVVQKSRTSIPNHSRLSIVRLSAILLENSDISITWEVAGGNFAKGCINLRQCGVAKGGDEMEADWLLISQKANAVY